jgi:exportin-1
MDMLTKNLDIALQVLDDVIMTRWKVLPRDQCQGNDGLL